MMTSAKILIVIVAFTIMAASLILLRYERTQLAHELTDLHRQFNRTQIDLWKTQVKASRMTPPDHFSSVIHSAQLVLEPVTPVMPRARQSQLATNPNYSRRNISQ